MSRRITVKTGARLHFGFLACKPQSGREFGGAGLMLDSPGFEIVVRESDRFSYDGPPIWCERVKALALRLQNESFVGANFAGATGVSPVSSNQGVTDARQELPGLEIEIRAEIPPHIGLGSGTQLGMALAAAIERLHGEEQTEPEALAHRVTRGMRSALGIHGFARGGFLVDAGKLAGEDIGTLAARADFPAHWRFLLVTPKTETGLAGASECEAFGSLPPMSPETTARLCGIVVTSMLPSVIEADLERCGDSLFEFGRIVGEYFAPVQAGTYADPSMSELVSHLRNSGIRGVGQTSWGPTIFALCSNQHEGEQLAGDIQSDDRWSDCRFQVVGPKNTGAVVQTCTEPPRRPRSQSKS